jgi:hypothetical protein
MTDLLQMAAAFFTERQWPNTLIERPRAVEITHAWSGIPFKSRATVTGGGPSFLYHSLCPERATPDRRAAVAEYLLRVNAVTLVGGFELDWDEGEIRFRTAIDLRGTPMTDALMSGVVYPNHQAMTDWLPHLIAVVHGEQAPAEAFREARESIG